MDDKTMLYIGVILGSIAWVLVIFIEYKNGEFEMKRLKEWWNGGGGFYCTGPDGDEWSYVTNGENLTFWLVIVGGSVVLTVWIKAVLWYVAG